MKNKYLLILGLTLSMSMSNIENIPFLSIVPLFNSSKAEAAVTISNDYVWMDMPQTGNQNDNWSCGPTSAARVINFYGHNVNRNTLVSAVNREFIIPPSFRVPAPTLIDPSRTRKVDVRTGTTPHVLRDVMKQWEGDNVKLERRASFNKLLGLLRDGKPVVVLLRVGTIDPGATPVGISFSGTWPEMHWVTVHGFSADEEKIYYTETNGKTYQYSYRDFQSKWDWRVGAGLANEALFANGVEPKTMIWVDRVPPAVANLNPPATRPRTIPENSDFSSSYYFTGDFNGDQADDIAFISSDSRWHIVNGRNG
ncbi:C39 family peptidase, partial [Adonisia turfae]